MNASGTIMPDRGWRHYAIGLIAGAFTGAVILYLFLPRGVFR